MLKMFVYGIREHLGALNSPPIPIAASRHGRWWIVSPGDTTRYSTGKRGWMHVVIGKLDVRGVDLDELPELEKIPEDSLTIAALGDGKDAARVET